MLASSALRPLHNKSVDKSVEKSVARIRLSGLSIALQQRPNRLRMGFCAESIALLYLLG
jgi:hypothetical protein